MSKPAEHLRRSIAVIEHGQGLHAWEAVCPANLLKPGFVLHVVEDGSSTETYLLQTEQIDRQQNIRESLSL